MSAAPSRVATVLVFRNYVGISGGPGRGLSDPIRAGRHTVT